MFAASRSGSEDSPRSKGKGPAWMGTGSARGPRRPTPQWKPSAPKQFDPEARQRAIRAAVATVAALLLAGFIYYLLTRPEPTPLVALRASAYPLQMPPLAFAEEDVDLLAKISPQNVRVMPVDFSSTAATLENFGKHLKAAGRQFNPLRRGSNVIVVYIAAHGVVNERGQPCLVSPTANPFESETWLPLAKLLAMIREEPTLAGKKKLILLDCQRVYSCWRCGWLESRFTDDLAAAVKAEDDADLYVISASGPGQIGWPAPELRGSVFGHYLARALRGEASGPKSTVSLGELFRYIAGEVAQYSLERRGVRQQPMLWHRDGVFTIDQRGTLVGAQNQAVRIDDFTLAYIDRWQKGRKLSELQAAADPLTDAKRLLSTPSEKGTNTTSASSSLQLLWQRYHQRRLTAAAGDRSLPGYVYDPVAWASIQQRLSAIGERLLAGKQYQGPVLEAEIDKLAKDLADDQTWSAHGALPRLDLPQTTSGAAAARSDPLAAGDNLFEAYLKAEPDKKSTIVPRGTTRARLVRDIYAALTTSSPPADPRASLSAAIELLKLAPPGDTGIDLIESHFLTLLDRGLPPATSLAPAQLAMALSSRQFAERAANPADLRVHYLLETLVNSADDKRRDAEDLLFLGSDLRRSETLFNDALGSPNSPAGYQAATRRGQKIAEFLRLRDEVWSDLPIVAEWHFVRAHLGERSAALQFLSTMFTAAVELDDAIERTLLARDEEPALAARFARCENAYESLHQSWHSIRADLENVYDLPTNIEQAYRRAANVRDAELALHWPPLVANSGPFLERYRQTLEQWSAQPSAPASAASGSSGQSTPPAEIAIGDSPKADDERYRFLQQLHRVLAYTFIDPYDQHRHATPWDERQIADTIFRTGQGGHQSTWQDLNKRLDAYNDAIKNESPAWDASHRALAASTTLRQWDRRVRVASLWLCSFQPDLRRPTQPTPTRWLQEYDAAHLTAWHAYRASGDFWGTGLPPASAPIPYFAEAIDQCDVALPNALRPIRYDIPGGPITSFSEHSSAALQALNQWEPIQFPRSLNVSVSPAAEKKFDVAVQSPADSAKDLRLPPGVATLSFTSSADAAERLAFDAAGRQSSQAVRLPLADRAPLTFTAFVQPAGNGPPTAGRTSADARLWYRGHVRTKPSPSAGGPPQFIHYEFVRPHYPPPTVLVRGKDAPRGAVLFIFDCSSSMRDADGRFLLAKQALKNVLTQLQNEAGNDLRVGLMAYGRRTPADGDPPILYQFDKMPDDPNNLTPLGRQQRDRLGAQFKLRFPHPDRDVEECVPIANATAADVSRELDNFAFEQCRGCTPLYYSIQQALQRGFSGLPQGIGLARQIVVISDGVNMPYDSDNGVIRLSAGLKVNNADREALETALANRTIQVSLVLFSSEPRNPTERQQREALEAIARAHPNFTVRHTPRATDIARAILDSFPKTAIELRSAQPGAAAQPLAFNQPQEVKDWGADGLLRRDLERRLVRLKLPGEDRTIEQEVSLLGGERVVLRYHPREGQLTFEDDGLTLRGYDAAEAPRIADSRKLIFDALDPERAGRNITRFNFRIRDDDRDHRFAPRPRYVWLEVKPRGIAGDAADLVFPCIDVAWPENINLPRLQMPVERWPECPTARVQAWFRYSDPQYLHQAKIATGESGRTLPLGPDKWLVEQTGGDAGSPRKITVTWQPSEPQPGVEKLFERAVWLSPPPDVTRRIYALDGAAAVHEFTYSRREDFQKIIEIQIVSRQQFQQEAYFAECEFNAAN